jgi:hypothetical protein
MSAIWHSWTFRVLAATLAVFATGSLIFIAIWQIVAPVPLLAAEAFWWGGAVDGALILALVRFARIRH